MCSEWDLWIVFMMVRTKSTVEQSYEKTHGFSSVFGRNHSKSYLGEKKPEQPWGHSVRVCGPGKNQDTLGLLAATNWGVKALDHYT